MSSSLCDTLWLSEKRKNLLLLLMEGPRDIDQIKTSLNVTSKAMMPQIKILKKQELVIQQEDGTYELSDVGRLIVENMLPLINTIDVIEENREYWTSRDLSIIPEALFKRLGEIGQCMLIEPDLNHLFDLPREFTENLKKSQKILTLISYYHPLYPSLYAELAKDDVEMSLLLTESVLERMSAEQGSEFETFLKAKNVEVEVCGKNSRLPTIAVTDRFMYLCLFDKQGKYDHRTLMSFDSSALLWGEELFKHYRAGIPPSKKQ
ncbi:MAG: winged helix-turn-helix domain-containing protein [Methanosarcinaceae archaeon]|nr:winged helix-turn-helix domain-containing protein [Methanosarcinaceae archaeon]MDD4331814.1 winged helix-turn-helix domain-containing protein [Methanosarcinaceae archaeon]MDD4750024.1 winged helix-turn-helix domain-containing protein [Methanosarcinaceae archaeon]